MEKNKRSELQNCCRYSSINSQVIELKKALEKSQLKVESLETMIKVSDELKIKIRKSLASSSQRLRQKHPYISVGELCALFDVTSQR